MAQIQTDCFSIGSTVHVKTCYDEDYEGQVMAFDLTTKLLILSKWIYFTFPGSRRSAFLLVRWLPRQSTMRCCENFTTDPEKASRCTLSANLIFFSSAESNSETSSKLNDVFIVNLLFCKDITVKKELNGAENHSQEPQSINLQRVSVSSSRFESR